LAPIALTGVPELRTSGEAVSLHMRRLAPVAAFGLHLAVFLWLVDPWRNAREHPPLAAMPVTLVFEPPAKPPPPPAPPPKPQPKPQPQQAAPPEIAYRESGPDTETRMVPPPPDDGKSADESVPPPAPAPQVAMVAPPPPPPAPAPAPGNIPDVAPPKPETPRPEARPKEDKPPTPPRPAAAPRPAPHPPASMRRALPGERETKGDPYLNAVSVEFEKHRFYPDLGRPLGLRGTAHLGVVVDRAGNIQKVSLEASSGADLLDRAAVKMVRDTRFPPPPADIPGDYILIFMDIPMAPP